MEFTQICVNRCRRTRYTVRMNKENCILLRWNHWRDVSLTKIHWEIEAKRICRNCSLVMTEMIAKMLSLALVEWRSVDLLYQLRNPINVMNIWCQEMIQHQVFLFDSVLDLNHIATLGARNRFHMNPLWPMPILHQILGSTHSWIGQILLKKFNSNVKLKLYSLYSIYSIH